MLLSRCLRGVDLPLLWGLLLLSLMGLFVLYSASGQNMATVLQQGIRFLLGFVLLFFFAWIPPEKYRSLAIPLFTASIILLIVVLGVGHIGKGAQRWLGIGLLRFQPAEIMKLALPMMLARYLHDKPLPPSFLNVIVCCSLIALPVVLVAKQPDLGTAVLIAVAGFSILFLSGLGWRVLRYFVGLAALSVPLLWHNMHEYQRDRVFVFLDPERDPLGKGYNIIQSKIAIGSGGFFGKGWLKGSQSHLHFLPEHATDFIFSVIGEELGLLGCLGLLSLYAFIVGRSLYLSSQATDTFSRLLSAGIALTFGIAVCVNVGMVSGIVPVVGVPLPLVSYGGTSIMTVLSGFGILMSIYTHRKLLKT